MLFSRYSLDFNGHQTSSGVVLTLRRAVMTLSGGLTLNRVLPFQSVSIISIGSKGLVKDHEDTSLLSS